MNSNSISVSPTLRRLLEELETKCNADCCNQDAFDISNNLIMSWRESERINRDQELIDELNILINQIKDVETKIKLNARGLESEWSSSNLKKFFSKLLHSYEHSATRV